ncbi:cation channel sperm-associated auxiliary subunit gamma [Rhea pennata]|uniref:cation channel sperm-associated auxiliary subunit gamma n=1 Tax=Rhea pennata TaxID=8795 RepID=UPI002E25581E
MAMAMAALAAAAAWAGCAWRVALTPGIPAGARRHVFARQHPEASVAAVFEALTDTAVDMAADNAHYFGFPYYLEIRLSCARQEPERATRRAHLRGLCPVVTVTFEEPVHPVRQKPERLQIKMRAVPYRHPTPCDSEELCRLRWYTPMPMVNGSAVMDVWVQSNMPDFGIRQRRFSVNVNGYVKETEKGPQCTIGHRVTKLKELMDEYSPSRPLWATVDKAPVLILGGFSKNKVILLSDTKFEDLIAVEVDIDSCWIGSLTCPWTEFSSTILDAIATESTLFIRQNQLVYYFTGNYSILHMDTQGSTLWTRVLNRVCVSKLNPVPFSHNGSEYVIAIGGGQQKAEFFLGTVRDGVVHFSDSIRAEKKTVCEYFEFSASCKIQWAVYIPEENKTLLLVQQEKHNTTSYHIVACEHENLHFSIVYNVPYFRPKATEKSFVMLMGFEEYSDTPMVLRGLSYNPFSTIFYIWGNAILQSYDIKNYIFLSEFSGESVIKYFIQSYRGEIVCVTETEEVWFFMEGSSVIEKVFPSRAWSMYASIQLLKGSHYYGVQESSLSFFYSQEGLQQLVYVLKKGDKNGRIVKRKFPITYILSHRCFYSHHYSSSSSLGLKFIGFTNLCPFTVMKFRDLPKPQRFSRLEHYRAEPPVVMDETGFHNNKSLAVYQGLVFHLLWLHSDYNRPYADPVHDPTWRWWKNRKQDADYYLYLASMGSSPGGLYINMEHYVKIYDLRSNNELPEQIYLDKSDVYSFSVTLSIRSTREENMWEKNFLSSVKLTVVLSHPFNLVFFLQRRNLVNRASVLYKVSIQDTALYPQQELSGKNLLKSSMVLKVVNSATNCYQYSESGPALQGYKMVPVYIGCPPGKRMAFDITNTLKHTTSMNKRYFNCVGQNSEMPCFFFEDVFYPLFLIQDMVTGDSGSFSGRYTLKVIGGGPNSEDAIVRYKPEDIWKYNSPLSSTESSLIWQKADRVMSETDPQGYPIHSSTSNGIRWLCQRNSPCHDVSPVGLTAPSYFFLVVVSNKDVDTSTYCDYDLEFVIHVHGLQLSSTRKLYFMKMTMSTLIGLITVYFFYCRAGRKIMASFFNMVRKLEEASALSAGSTSTSVSSVMSRMEPSDYLLSTNSVHSAVSEPVHRRQM